MKGTGVDAGISFRSSVCLCPYSAERDQVCVSFKSFARTQTFIIRFFLWIKTKHGGVDVQNLTVADFAFDLSFLVENVNSHQSCVADKCC